MVWIGWLRVFCMIFERLSNSTKDHHGSKIPSRLKSLVRGRIYSRTGCLKLFRFPPQFSPFCKSSFGGCAPTSVLPSMLTQGVLGSLMNGLTYIPAPTLLNPYSFYQHPMAIGVAWSGSFLPKVSRPSPSAVCSIIAHWGSATPSEYLNFYCM